MKYTLTINQLAAFNLGFLGKLDLVDLCLFDAFKSFANSAGCEKLIDDGGIWFWISYGKIIEEMPFSGLNSKDVIYRRMKKLEACKIIKFHPNNQKMTKTFFQWGENYDAMERKQEGVIPTDEKPKVAKDLRMKNRTPTDEKPKVPTDEKSDNTNTSSYPYTNPVEGEREVEKNTPTLEDVIEEIKTRNAETRDVEAKKKEKDAQGAANYEPSDFGIYSKVPLTDLLEDDTGLLVQSFDASTIPGAIIRTAEIMPTNGTQITIKTGMNEAGETYVFEHTERVTNPTPAARILNGVNRAPLAEDSDGAQKLIMAWATNGALETVQNWYNLARRKFTPEDLELITAKFCGTYSTIADAGRRSLFFSDPVQFFRNKGRVFIQDQKSFERMNEPKNGMPETKNNLPKSIRRF